MHPNPTNNRVHEMLLFELASPISSQQWDTCSSFKKKKKTICMRQLMPTFSYFVDSMICILLPLSIHDPQ